jgi:bla regulator protein BlaR1
MIPETLSPLINHLWQSTLFAGIAWLLVKTLRRNAASIRYGIWMLASMKFLLPFSLLVDAGTHLHWPAASLNRPAEISLMVEQIAQPFPLVAASSNSATPVIPRSRSVVPVLAGVWLIGVLATLGYWLRWYRNMRTTLRASTVIDLGDILIPVLASPHQLEPGVFGIVRPVLLVPEGIIERLTPDQLRAVIAHELVHVRRRDNLTITLHMLVEAIFWFHPLVWFIRTQLVKEREQACDEAVLRAGTEAHVYADAILSTCRFYLTSNSISFSAVTGSDLKKRIEAIMRNKPTVPLASAQKALLAAAVILCFSVPVVLGSRQAGTTFDVASIKPSDPAAPQRGNPIPCAGVPRLTPQRFQATGVTTYTLIAWAFGQDSCVSLAQHNLLSGAPGWVRSEKFDIDAVMPEGTPTYTNIQLMDRAAPKLQLLLQTLLTDRFKLALHRDSREMSVYALVPGKTGFKLDEAKTGSCIAPGTAPAPGSPPRFCGGSIVLDRGATILFQTFAIGLDDFAQRLTPRLDRPVLNQTGISGVFDFSINFTPDDATPVFPRAQLDGPSGPSFFTAIEEQLGLKLEPTKARMPMLVIDQVEHPKPN